MTESSGKNLLSNVTRFFYRKIIGETLISVIEQLRFLPVMSSTGRFGGGEKNDVGRFGTALSGFLNRDQSIATASCYVDRYNINVLGTSGPGRGTSRTRHCGPPLIPLHGVRDQSDGSAFPLYSSAGGRGKIYIPFAASRSWRKKNTRVGGIRLLQVDTARIVIE